MYTTEFLLPFFIICIFCGVVLPLYLYSRHHKEILIMNEKQHRFMLNLRDQLNGVVKNSLSLEIVKIDTAFNEAKDNFECYKEELFDEYSYYEKLRLGVMYLNNGKHAKAAKNFLQACGGWQRNGNITNVIFTLNLLKETLPHISGAGFRFIEKALDKEGLCLDTILIFLLADELNKADRKTVTELKKIVEAKRNEVFVS